MSDLAELGKIQKLQGVLGCFPQEELPPKHYFAQGSYARELFIPAHTFVVGKMHKFEHLTVQVYGDITVYSETRGREHLEGYHVMVTPPNTKRAVYTHADTLWLTFHVTDKTDLDELEEELIVPDDVEAIDHYAQHFLSEMRRIEA